MENILTSEEGRAVLRRIRPHRTLLALDFDGTLAPLVPRPEMAFTPKGTIALLKHLQRFLPVAVVTGRSRKDIRTRVGLRPTYIIGNHGLETPGLEDIALQSSKSVRSWLRQMSDFTENFGDDIFIENKKYSLSLHYRQAKQPHVTRARLLRRVDKLTPPARMIPGKLLINLTPEDAPHKGTAVKRLMTLSHARNAIFIGDDVTDEDVFRLDDQRIISVRVGKSSRSKADFFIRSQGEVERLLEEILKLVSGV